LFFAYLCKLAKAAAVVAAAVDNCHLPFQI